MCKIEYITMKTPKRFWDPKVGPRPHNLTLHTQLHSTMCATLGRPELGSPQPNPRFATGH